MTATSVMCKGKVKVRYEDQAAAEQALVDVRDQRGHPSRPQAKGKTECRCYRCPSCDGWHLTSRKRWSA